MLSKGPYRTTAMGPVLPRPGLRTEPTPNAPPRRAALAFIFITVMLDILARLFTLIFARAIAPNRPGTRLTARSFNTRAFRSLLEDLVRWRAVRRCEPPRTRR